MWQNGLTPIQKIIGDGCHLNRNIKLLFARQFHKVQIKEFTPENMSELVNYLYQGIATIN